MPTDTHDFRTLMHDFQNGCPDAAARLCNTYQSHILRVVRRRLMDRLRTRYDSLDFVHDVWVSFFANPPRGARFDDQEALIRYLARMAHNKVNEEMRRHTSRKCDIGREESINYIADDAENDNGPRDHGPSPSQIVGAEDQFQNFVRHRPPVHQRILSLLRQGMSHREIADALHTTEKTIWRLVRRIEPEAPGS